MNPLLKQILLVCVFLLALSGQAIADSLSDAKRVYYAGDYAKSAKLFVPLAEQGDASAQQILGVIYNLGQGVPQDRKEAAKWFQLAASQGDASAQFNLAVMYDNGQGVHQDYKEAAKWYRLAAEQGDALAQFNLAVMHDVGQGVPQDYEEAEKWYRLAAKQGNVKAQFSLGFMYANGQGAHQNHKEAAKWYRIAAEQGDAKAQFNLGVMYDQGEGVQQDHKEAAKWYRLAAEQGNTHAQAKLNTVYGKAAAVPQSGVEAEVQAGQEADVKAKAEEEARVAKQASNLLGSADEQDTKVEVARVKTEHEQQAAATRQPVKHTPAGSPEILLERCVKDWAAAWSAKNVSGYLAAYIPDFTPEGMSHDAWEKLRVDRISKPKLIEVTLSDIKFSVQDDSHATASFTQSYRSDGYHVKTGKILQMVKQSGRWLIAEESTDKAVKANAEAKSRGMHGKGVLRGNANAVKRIRIAAEQGDAEAQFNLGEMYNEGKGVPLDYNEATKWYRLSAETLSKHTTAAQH